MTSYPPSVPYIVRFTCIWLVIINNIVLSVWGWRKIKRRAEKLANKLLHTASFYVTISTFQLFYNFIYRYIIRPEDCEWSDIIDEWLIIIARLDLYMFYTYRLEASFEGIISSNSPPPPLRPFFLPRTHKKNKDQFSK